MKTLLSVFLAVQASVLFASSANLQAARTTVEWFTRGVM